jgi:phage minor structural protein
MECVFLTPAGQTLFTRTDMESGHWVVQEMSMTADFPYDPGKVIQRGQWVSFRDPSTDEIQVFEVQQIVNSEPDHYQQITAEHICIAELSDCHINKTEITDKTAAQALTTALTGTLWSKGHNYASGTQTADFSRGSVWDAVATIQQNWNVHIIPRLVISSNGAISGRYLDIYPLHSYVEESQLGAGIRLSIRKNLYDPAVTYDDSEVITAMYGYGGSVEVAQSEGQDKNEELTFKDEVWTQTAAHPAKPADQTYLEWPEKTALYGRNGVPRFGYYQNGNIKDAAVLLEKTWESLQESSTPKISISGTVADLRRLGYNDQPIRLLQNVLVEIEETGEKIVQQIICLDVDLIDPTGNRVEIGDYISNIVYITRNTNDKASGGGGGGGGKGSMTNLEDDEAKTWTQFVRTQEKIGMVVGTYSGTDMILGGEIILAINDDGTEARISADKININGVVVAINASQLIIDADNIDIRGIIDSITTWDITVGTIDATEGTSAFHDIFVETQVDCADGKGMFDTIEVEDLETTSLKVNNTTASWQSTEVVTDITSQYYTGQYFAIADANLNITGRQYVAATSLVTPTKATIHYLGY